MLDRNAVIEIVRNYASDIIETHGVHLRMVILYGSFARGTQHEWSDIDVALVADEFTGAPEDYDFFPSVGIRKPYTRIEAMTYPTDYFRKGSPFIKKKKKDGIVIMNK
jgi:tRNA nucleotidyltransferase (CCA-adding enzyme)